MGAETDDERPPQHPPLQARVAALATRQHGVVAAGQLEALGMGARRVRRWVAAARLQRLYPGVFAVGHRALTPDGRRMAVVFACGDGACLSHLSAAELHGVRAGSTARWHVTVPHGGRTTGPPGVILHRSRRLPPDIITRVCGIPVTSLERTLLDVAGSHPRALASMVHESEVSGLLDVRAVRAVMARHPGRRGLSELDDALGDPAAEPSNSVSSPSCSPSA